MAQAAKSCCAGTHLSIYLREYTSDPTKKSPKGDFLVGSEVRDMRQETENFLKFIRDLTQFWVFCIDGHHHYMF